MSMLRAINSDVDSKLNNFKSRSNLRLDDNTFESFKYAF